MQDQSIRVTRPNSRRGEILALVILAAVVLSSRLPFVTAGYGRDPDAWRMARAARLISVTGDYHTSRVPCFPVPEMTYSSVWKLGYVAFNSITALFSVMAVVFFALILKKYGSKDYILAGIGLAFTPVFFINSTNSMDYGWALAFSLAAVYFALLPRPILAGAAIGLAIGCRITSVAMVIPLIILLLDNRPPRRTAIVNILKLLVLAAITSAVLFIPVFSEHGLSFLKFSEGTRTVKEAMTTAGREVWGQVGVIAFLIAAAAVLLYPAVTTIKRSSIPSQTSSQSVRAWVAVICIYFIGFLRLPHEAGYLLPIVPFTILIFARYLPRSLFIVFVTALAVSPFVEVERSEISRGPILRNHRSRAVRLEYAKRILTETDKLTDGRIVIVSGWMLPTVEVLQHSVRPESRVRTAKFVYLFDETQLNEHLREGFKVYVVPNQRYFNIRARKIDLVKHGGTLLFKE